LPELTKNDPPDDILVIWRVFIDTSYMVVRLCEFSLSTNNRAPIPIESKNPVFSAPPAWHFAGTRYGRRPFLQHLWSRRRPEQHHSRRLAPAAFKRSFPIWLRPLGGVGCDPNQPGWRDHGEQDNRPRTGCRLAGRQDREHTENVPRRSQVVGKARIGTGYEPLRHTGIVDLSFSGGGGQAPPRATAP
jgi:hypothetical protein